MAIVKNISVGDVQYYLTDAIPTHTAPKGSISIVQEDGYDDTIYMNNNGGAVWVKLFVQTYGQIFFTGQTNNTNTLATDTLNSWYNQVSFSWESGDGTSVTSTLGSSVDKQGFTRSQIATSNAGASLSTILANTILPSIVLIKSHSRYNTNTRWNSIESGINRNNIVPTKYNGTTVKSLNATGGIKNIQIENIVSGSWLNNTYRYTAREAGGGSNASKAYVPNQGQIQVLNLDTPRFKYLINETWESSGFTEGGWTVVNDVTNKWVVGTAEKVTGNFAAYISNDGGVSATYTKTANDVSHFYKDFTLPAGFTTAYLIFDWKCWGENAAAATQYDYGTVCIVDTGTTPVAGTEVITTEATGNNTLPIPRPSGNGRIGANRNLSATGQLGKFNEGLGGSNAFWKTVGIDMSNYIGQSKRIVFTWKDDTTAGDDPPMCIDNIKLIYF